VGAVGIVVAAFVGALAGLTVGTVADAIATPRYGPDSEGHDPEDQALALAAAPTSARTGTAAVVVTTVAFSLLAGEFAEVDVWAFFAVLTWVYVVAAVIDLQYLRLPDVLTLPAAAFAAVAALALAERHLDRPGAALAGFLGAAAVVGFVWGFSTLFRLLRGKEAFGLGDVKLLVSLGASVGWLGWAPLEEVSGPVTMVVYVAMAGFLIGSLAGLPAAGFRLSKHIPFGPFLMVGWFVVVLFADSLRG
jgi:prepilin signal peptidase PulO-like enzyme (type II secretory pathway)